MQDIEEIYSKYGEIVYKYVFCLTGNEDTTEEIVQETFLVAVKDINKFRGECKISTWLCQISKYIWYKKEIYVFLCRHGDGEGEMRRSVRKERGMYR